MIHALSPVYTPPSSATTGAAKGLGRVERRIPAARLVRPGRHELQRHQLRPGREPASVPCGTVPAARVVEHGEPGDLTHLVAAGVQVVPPPVGGAGARAGKTAGGGRLGIAGAARPNPARHRVLRVSDGKGGKEGIGYPGERAAPESG